MENVKEKQSITHMTDTLILYTLYNTQWMIKHFRMCLAVCLLVNDNQFNYADKQKKCSILMNDG